MWEAIIIVIGLLADQLSKAWVSANLYGRSVTILPGVLDYSYVENTGAAFGMLGKNTVLLAVFSGLMSLVLLYILLRYRRQFHRLSCIALAFVLSGAVGNFIDRAFHGFVVDFIELKFVNFAVFNIADIFVHNLKKYAAGQPLDNQVSRKTLYVSGGAGERLLSTF